MADSTVQIKLVTTADTSGAQRTTDAVKKVEQATKAANNEEAQRRASAAAAATSLNALHGAQTRAAGSSRNMGMAVMQASRGIQDLQYGLHGAVNNFEGIATALGLGAGVAGVVTLLAVAVQQLGPKVVDWFNSLNQEGADLDKLRKQLGDVSTALRDGYSESQQAATEASAAFTEQVKVESRAVDDEKKAIDAVIASLRLRNQIQDSAEEFALRNQVEGIRASDLSPDEKLQQEASARLQFEQAKKSRADQLANEEAAAAQLKINADLELAALREKQARQTEQDLAQSERVAKILDPKNAGSLTALQDRRRTLMATDPTAVGKTPQELQARIDELDATIASRIAEIEAFASKVVGGSISLSDPSAVRGFQKSIWDRAASLRGESRSLNDQASRSQRAFDAAGSDRALQQRLRDLQLQQQQREISTGAGARPADAPLFEPASPFGPAPLPRLAPGLPGVQPADPLGFRPLPLPGTGNFAQPPPNPLDMRVPAPLPEPPRLDVKPLEDVKKSNEAANSAVLTFAQAVAAENEAMRRKLAELEAKLKNSRS